MDGKMVPIPDYGDHMTMEEWISCVKCGGFINYDGAACYATNTEMHQGSNCFDVYPSDVADGKVNIKWTHVVWFNR